MTIYTIYNNHKPIAIVRGEKFKKEILKISQNYLSKPTKDFSEIMDWYEISQKGTLIGYFSKLGDISSVLYGEFNSKILTD